MKKLFLSISTLTLSLLQLNAQVTPVNPSTFSGHYFTEETMKIKYGSFSKKTNEINLTFDEKTGLLSGLVDDAKEKMDKLSFYSDPTKKANATKSGVWY